jgi:hypothetical protein
LPGDSTTRIVRKTFCLIYILNRHLEEEVKGRESVFDNSADVRRGAKTHGKFVVTLKTGKSTTETQRHREFFF